MQLHGARCLGGVQSRGPLWSRRSRQQRFSRSERRAHVQRCCPHSGVTAESRGRQAVSAGERSAGRSVPSAAGAPGCGVHGMTHAAPTTGALDGQGGVVVGTTGLDTRRSTGRGLQQGRLHGPAQHVSPACPRPHACMAARQARCRAAAAACIRAQGVNLGPRGEQPRAARLGASGHGSGGQLGMPQRRQGSGGRDYAHRLAPQRSRGTLRGGGWGAADGGACGGRHRC